jgi:hypothetical protein
MTLKTAVAGLPHMDHRRGDTTMKSKRPVPGARLLTMLAVIGSGIFLCGPSLWAQPISMEIDMTKGVSAEGESYQVDCLITGNDLEDLTLYVPGNKPMKFSDIPRVDEIRWKASRSSFDQLQHDFPAGGYELRAQPWKRNLGSYTIDLTHDFPPVPNILYPEDGATNVTFPLDITWEPLQGIQDLTIKLAYRYGWLEYGLSPDETSFTVEPWLWEPGQEYEVTLTGTAMDGKGNDLTTWRKTRFSAAQ